jgi:transposase-like protein
VSVLTPTTPSPYRGFRFSAEIIQHAAWLYYCFSLSLREVQLILAARGIVVSSERNPRVGPVLWADVVGLPGL